MLSNYGLNIQTFPLTIDNNQLQILPLEISTKKSIDKHNLNLLETIFLHKYTKN